MKMIPLRHRLLPLHASVDARIGGSIPHAHFVPVPPPARIGDIKHAAEIQIKIGLGNNPVLPVVVMLPEIDRKSTRLNSSHVAISYAVFCLKKKKKLELHHTL